MNLLILMRVMKKAIAGFFIVSIIVIPQLVHAPSDIPSSPRSRESIARVKPELECKLAEQALEYGAPIYIRIFKEKKELEVWIKKEDCFRLFKKYPVCTYGNGSLGPKTRKGDGQAPEGFYFVSPDRLNPVSNFHLSFNIGYPNRYDRVHGRTGGALMVHGSCVSIGCFAMTDKIIEEIYALADAAFRRGQPFFKIHIFPFRMTEENMERHKVSKWILFWENLKEGYDFFTHNGNLPPDVLVEDGRYVFQRM